MKAGHSPLLIFFFSYFLTRKRKVVFLPLENLCSCNIWLVRKKWKMTIYFHETFRKIYVLSIEYLLAFSWFGSNTKCTQNTFLNPIILNPIYFKSHFLKYALFLFANSEKLSMLSPLELYPIISHISKNIIYQPLQRASDTVILNPKEFPFVLLLFRRNYW